MDSVFKFESAENKNDVCYVSVGMYDYSGEELMGRYLFHVESASNANGFKVSAIEYIYLG